MQLGQSSGGESGERLLVVYLGVGRKSGRMVSMAKWDWVEKLEEWLQSLVECVRRDQCDIAPEGPGCPGTNWSSRRAVARLSTRRSSSMVSRLYW